MKQFHKPPKTIYQVLLGKFTTLVQTTKDGIPLPCYCRTIKEQVFSSFILLITHSTERILLKDADSVKMLPQGISSFIPRDPLMTRNPTNSHIVDSGKGRNDLIAIPDKFGFEHTRVQRHQCCLTIRENIDCLTPISQTKILTSTFHNGCNLRLKNCRIKTHRDHQLPAWSHPHNSSACAAFCFRAVCKPFKLRWWKRFPSLGGITITIITNKDN
ncbi:hypothetical protein J6590_053199 [Homalodisca vitripennis]|nr:hypothetical protein J6590_053199 [Homalodisca vitripennis]